MNKFIFIVLSLGMFSLYAMEDSKKVFSEEFEKLSLDEKTLDLGYETESEMDAKDVEVYPGGMNAKEQEFYFDDCLLERFVLGKPSAEDLENPIIKKLIAGLEAREKQKTFQLRYGRVKTNRSKRKLEKN